MLPMFMNIRHERGKYIPVGMLSHKDILMAVLREYLQTMVINTTRL